MTVQLRSEPVRVTSWLAGWLDYVFAIVLVAGRRVCAPLLRRGPEPAMQPEFAADLVIGAPGWTAGTGEADPSRSGSFVKAAEIVMLSVAFFVAAHLLSGGTPTVTAPDLNPLGLIPDHARAEGLPTAAAAVTLDEVQASTFVYNVPRETPVEAAPTEAAVAEPLATEEAALAPASRPETSAAALPAATPAPQPAPQAAAAPPPPAPQAPTVTPVQPPVAQASGRNLTAGELRSAALAAGWPAALLPELEAVAWCESRFHTHAEYYGAMGLMQVIPLWFTVAGVDANMWWDPVVNLTAAKAAYDSDIRNGYAPWSAWGCSP